MPVAELGEHRVFYEEQGSRDPVLLVSGLAADHTMWRYQVAALEHRHRVIVFDNPGIGRTNGFAGPYTTELFADVTAALARHLGIERAHIVGASMGAAIALQTALRYPELVRTLSVHAGWARPDNYLVQLFRSWQASARSLSRLELCRQIWLFAFTVWWFNDRPQALEQLERETLEVPDLQTPAQFCAQAEACIAHDVLDRLAEVAVPAYISVGDRDVLTPAHHAYRMKERMPHARLRLWKQMGHAPYWEIPDDFNARQLEFLAAH